MEYWKLKYLDPGERRRAIGYLKALRRFLDAQLPKRTAQGTLVLGTWNIRNFDNNRFGNGPRLEETFLYGCWIWRALSGNNNQTIKSGEPVPATQNCAQL